MKLTVAAALLVVSLAFVAWWTADRPDAAQETRPPQPLLTRYRAELDASHDLQDVPEFVRLREGRAVFGALAPGAGTRRIEVALMGNLNGYASPCACSSKGRVGGLAVIGAAVARWRGQERPGLIDIGDSLLPEGDYPPQYERLFLEKASLIGKLYRVIGVDAFCPSPTDLHVFKDLAALAEWSSAAGLRSILTNLPVDAGTDAIGHTAIFGDNDFPITLYSVCDPGQPEQRTALAAFPLDPLSETLARCELPSAGVRIMVLHDVSLADVVAGIPQPLVRTIYVDRRHGTVRAERNPLVREARFRGRVIRPEARGQSLSILQFLARGTENGVLINAAPERAAFARSDRMSREPEPGPDPGIRFLESGIEFREGSEETVGSMRAVAEPLADHRSMVLKRLLADPPYAADEVPETRVRLLPQRSCGACHEAAVRGWESGPHAHALKTLLEGERKDQAEAGCVRCHLSANSRLSLDAPARTEDHPLRMRGVLSGISCVTCHSDVSDAHLDGTSQDSAKAAARSACRTCHDPINSPSFDFDTYVRKLGCCGTAHK